MCTCYSDIPIPCSIIALLHVYVGGQHAWRSTTPRILLNATFQTDGSDIDAAPSATSVGGGDESLAGFTYHHDSTLPELTLGQLLKITTV